jgi:hypothetical protein
MQGAYKNKAERVVVQEATAEYVFCTSARLKLKYAPLNRKESHEFIARKQWESEQAP